MRELYRESVFLEIAWIHWTVLTIRKCINTIGSHVTARSHSIDARLQIFVALNFYATSDFYSSVLKEHGISEASVCRIVERVTEAIVSIKDDILTFRDAGEKKVEFLEKCGFPNTLLQHVLAIATSCWIWDWDHWCQCSRMDTERGKLNANFIKLTWFTDQNSSISTVVFILTGVVLLDDANCTSSLLFPATTLRISHILTTEEIE